MKSGFRGFLPSWDKKQLEESGKKPPEHPLLQTCPDLACEEMGSEKIAGFEIKGVTVTALSRGAPVSLESL